MYDFTGRIPEKWSWVRTDDPQFNDALHMVLDTDKNLVIVGPGGTGKSLMLKMSADLLEGNVVVLSTTGISAANLAAEGLVTSTVHSFFKFPPLSVYDGVFVKSELSELMQSVDTLIIDEVSMLNASLMDAVLRTMSAYRAFCEKKLPRIIMFGDVLQLPPVVDSDPVVTEYFSRWYEGTHMFYASPKFLEAGFTTIHLSEIYRQSDSSWKNVLNRIRTGEYTKADLAMVNTRVVNERKFIAEHPYMMYLVGTNKRAEALNNFHLDSRGGKTFDATIEGAFKVAGTNLLQEITLAPGMQVMCTHNARDRSYQNGTLGRVEYVGYGSVDVRTNDGRSVTVVPELWEQYEYTYDRKKNRIEHHVVGSFRQIACKPAFAVTIHKSQSLTLDSEYIDTASIGTFSPSLAYVALSRCTTLEGIGLSRPLEPRHIRVNREGMDFLDESYLKGRRVV